MINLVPKSSVIFLSIASVCLLPACKNGAGAPEEEIIAKTPVTVVSPVTKNLYETTDYMAVSLNLKKNTLHSSVTGIVENVAVTPGENVSRGKLLFTLKTLEASALQTTQQSDTGLGFNGIIKVYSPKEGVISRIAHYGGDFVQEGDELAVLSDPGSLVFILEVPYETAGVVEKNKGCTILLPDNRSFKAKIRERLPEMNIQNQTVSYILETSQPLRLPDNLIATVGIVTNVRPVAVVVPKDAVLGDETQTDFWVMKLINDSTAIKIPVIKGIENSDEVEITAPALTTGDRILNTGNYGLADTAAVVVIR